MSSLYLENSIKNTFVNLSLVYCKINTVSRYPYKVIKTIRPSDSPQPDYFYDFVLNILFPTTRIRSTVPVSSGMSRTLCEFFRNLCHIFPSEDQAVHQ